MQPAWLHASRGGCGEGGWARIHPGYTREPAGKAKAGSDGIWSPSQLSQHLPRPPGTPASSPGSASESSFLLTCVRGQQGMLPPAGSPPPGEICTELWAPFLLSGPAQPSPGRFGPGMLSLQS